MTSARIVYLYEAMDAAYDAEIIDRHSKALGHAPLIDRNFRSQHEAKTECAEEVARMRRVGVPDPDDSDGEIRVRLSRKDGGHLLLAVEDDGVGWAGVGPAKGKVSARASYARWPRICTAR
jgi:hypothetical protein